MQSIIFNTLKGHIEVLKQLGNEHYTTPITALSNATVGQHTRHIIEFFECLQLQYESGNINYDLRQRDNKIETDVNYAIECIDAILSGLNNPYKTLNLIVELDGKSMVIDSNYNRELYYNLEHCIHHQALIKVALLTFENITISSEFGVAPSTIQYRLQCAQ